MGNKNSDAIIEIDKLKKKANKFLDKKQYEKSIAALTAAADLAYNYNQFYVDQEMEDTVGEMTDALLNEKIITSTFPEKDNLKGLLPAKTVLFYDGIGFDARGIVTNHIQGLGEAKVKTVYVTFDRPGNEQVVMKKILAKYGIERRVIDTSSYLSMVITLNAIFEEVKPDMAFFYTFPYDVAGSIVFRAYNNKVIRILSDLTDHAFWLGRDNVDYIWSLRTIGANIAVYERKIPENRLLCSYLSADINKDIPFAGWPCDTTDKKVICSGGSIYKTLGDDGLYYYQISRHILTNHEDTVFVYCGAGDTTEIDKMKKDYPGRVYLLPERADFYQMIENCTLYLNTYPMFGGMMTRYAILASKVPVTLKHEHDADGLVPNQNEIKIEYDDLDNLLVDVDEMLNNADYLADREKLLKKGWFTAEDFNRVTKEIIEGLETEYSFKIERPDTEKFRSEYINRFNLREQLVNAVCVDGRRRRTLAGGYLLLLLGYMVKKIRMNYAK